MLRRHDFDIDYMLDVVFRLREIIERYQFLMAHVRTQPGGLPPYEFGGPESLPRYVRRMESALMEEAIALADGDHTAAAKLVGSPYLNHFQRALRRVGSDARARPARARSAAAIRRVS